MRRILTPNDPSGRVSFLFCGLVIAGIGYALYRNDKKGKEPSIEIQPKLLATSSLRRSGLVAEDLATNPAAWAKWTSDSSLIRVKSIFG